MSGNLAALQRWFQSRTMSGKAADAGREILPSRTLAPDERLGLYAGMYFLRLRDALAEDFKTVHALLGDDEFEKLARAYLAKHPSRHPSLNHLGDRLPDFLAGPVRVKRRALARDVARLEVAMQEVFDAPRAEPLDTKALAAVPPDAWPAARLRVAPAFRLLALDHAVNELVTAVRRRGGGGGATPPRNDDPLPAAPRRKSWVAVYRKSYAVWRMDVTEAMFAVLSALQRGTRLADAIAASGVADPSVVFAWFQDWRAEGLFTGIELPSPRKRARRKGTRAR